MSANVRIRPATPADLPAVLELDRALFAFDARFDDTLDAGWTGAAAGRTFFEQRCSRAEGAAWVAEGAGGLLGYLCGALMEAEDYRTVRTLAEVECMYVHPDARGTGVGRTLAEAFIAWAKAAGAERLRVVASAGNTAAVRFYEALDFRPHDLVLERPLNSDP
jgi:ribosomal protein S18 acetylase RimI-like enzyme